MTVNSWYFENNFISKGHPDDIRINHLFGNTLFCYVFTLTHCGLVTAYGNIDLGSDSGTGWLPDGTKPLAEPMLTYHQ